ncbi:MAG: MotA/TolQ/ExbB proton channel family protein [Paludibacteraceae bacterium]
MAKQPKKSRGKGISSGLVIFLCFLLALAIYNFVFGNSGNFVNGDTANHPINLLGTIHKGGYIVPILLTMLLTVLVLSVERFIAIRKARGTGDLTKFVESIKEKLEADDVAGAKEICAKQKGAVANVVNSALDKYKQMEVTTEGLTKEQKVLSIQKTLEEATALELPTMEQNLPVIASLTTLGTLVGLLGTVVGMIRSFQALASEGGTDSIALSTGISEALVNTAFGILTGALAVISYSYYTGKIDNITYAIDEIGFSIVNVFAAKHK